MRRAQRLPKGRAFDETYAKGTVIGGPLFVVRVRSTGAADTRWGFAVGKRLDKRAVVRNRVRRRLREAARGVAVEAGWDVVVTARKPVLDASYEAVRRAMVRAVSRAGLGGAAGG